MHEAEGFDRVVYVAGGLRAGGKEAERTLYCGGRSTGFAGMLWGEPGPHPLSGRAGQGGDGF